MLEQVPSFFYSSTKNSEPGIDPLKTTHQMSTIAFEGGNFSGNYLLWTAIFLVGAIALYFPSKESLLSSLLRDHDWAYRPNAFSTKIHALAIKFFSLGKNKLYSFQKNLPSLPVPNLEQTCQLYLDSVKPLLTEEEFKKTQEVVLDFQKREGPTLQIELLEYAQNKRNWLEEWWKSEVYLSKRESLAISSNWYGVGTTPKTIDYPDPQIGRASQAIKAVMSFKKMIDTKTYKTWKVANTFPICMEQYERLFGTCRVPGIPLDSIEVYSKSKHIVIFARNKMYPLDLYDKNGKEISLEELDRRLAAIKDDAAKRKEEIPEVNFLTSQDRDSWAVDRQRLLILGEENARSLKTIEEALFVIILEDRVLETIEDQSRDVFLNSNNRWYDKGVELIIDESGKIGGNMEHTGSDATITASMLEYFLRNEESFSKRQKSVVLETQPQPEPLQWTLSPELSEKIQSTKKSIHAEMVDYDLKAIVYNSYGKDFIKKLNLSPDGYIQIIIQLAYYKLNKKFCLTYETAATRLFYHGRTETIRSVSDASVAFVKAMIVEKRDPEAMKELLKKAIHSQQEYTKKAFLGQGIDRHLLVLKILARKKKQEPEIFTDKAYNLPWTLATSQTPCPNFPGGGFSPTDSNGYGVSYVVNPDHLCFHVTSKHSSSESNSELYMEAIRESLDDIKALFSSSE